MSMSNTSTVLKPVIQELVRTQYCGSPITLLLDKLHIVASGDENNEDDAYRLWLSDGVKTIQAVLVPELHPYLTAGEVREGANLQASKYSLVRTRRRNSKGWLWVLIILDMEVVGFDGREESVVEVEFRERIDGVADDGKLDAAIQDPITSVQDMEVKPLSTKRQRDSGQENSPPKKLKTGGSSTSPSPMKPKGRSPLGETSMNRSRTPKKAKGFGNVTSNGSPYRGLPWTE